MFYKYEIKNNGVEDILYLYLSLTSDDTTVIFFTLDITEAPSLRIAFDISITAAAPTNEIRSAPNGSMMLIAISLYFRMKG